MWGIIFVLSFWGLLAVYSSTGALAYTKHGGNVEIYKKGEREPILSLGHDITLAEYICDLHNLTREMDRHYEI